MAYEAIPQSVLIVSSVEKSMEYIKDILSETQKYDKVTAVDNSGEARRILANSTYDLVIINSPLRDEFGLELALYISENVSTDVIFIVKNEVFEEVCYKIEKYGIFTISKPLSKQLFIQVVNLISAVKYKLGVLEKQNLKLQIKLEEIKIVDRAKWTLIEYLKMTEAQAHRYIEKQAMDMRLTKKEVAQGILRTYEN